MSYSGVAIFERSEILIYMQGASIWAGMYKKMCTAGCKICPAIKKTSARTGERWSDTGCCA